MKKVLILTAIAILIAAIGAYVVWQLFLRPTISGPQTTNQVKDSTALLSAIKPISSAPVFDYWLNRSSNEIFYLSLTGEIYKITSDGREEKVNSRTVENINSIQPSLDGSKAIISLAVFDTTDKTYQPLPMGTISAAWDPKSNNRVAYLKSGGQTSSINLLTLSNKKSQEVIKLAQKDLELEWVVPDIIYLKQKSSSRIASSLWALDINKKTLRQIFKEEMGLTVKWSRDGSLGIKTTNALTNFPQLIDKDAAVVKVLSFIALSSKCSFENQKIYCAVPRNISPRTNLLDDYLMRKNYLEDDILVWDVASFLPDLIFDGTTQAIDVENLQIKNNRLFFINRYDQKLYRLDL